MYMKTNDGTPDAVKVACPVWSGGKGGDNIKTLPITISGNHALAGTFLLCVERGSCNVRWKCQAEFSGSNGAFEKSGV
ncbi:MAG: hypothetical protein K2N61_13100 [Lachnospiraceae bacterium]|nr:hypothetical protein [Lachnospiraceae bacterium]